MRAWATSLSFFTFMHWRRKWQPTPVFLPGESQGWGSLVGCHIWGHIKWTKLNRLSSSSHVNQDSIPDRSSVLSANKENSTPFSEIFDSNLLLYEALEEALEFYTFLEGKTAVWLRRLNSPSTLPWKPAFEVSCPSQWSSARPSWILSSGHTWNCPVLPDRPAHHCLQGFVNQSSSSSKS